MSKANINSLIDPVQLNPSAENTSASTTSIFSFAPQVNPEAEGTNAEGLPTAEGLELIRLSSDRLLTVAFTMDGVEVDAHYCNESDLRGYVRCNGERCALCRYGKEKKTMFLIPLFVPAYNAVQVLVVSKATHTTAMLPQLRAIFASQSNRLPLMLHMSKIDYSGFSVILEQPGEEGGFQEHPIINTFMDELTANREILTSVFQKFSNAELEKVSEVGRVLKLFGVSYANDK